MCSFCSKTDFTFLLQPITFEPLEINQSYIPHLKVLVCGINASGSQWCGCTFILCYTHLNLALLLYKQGLVATGVGITVHVPKMVQSTLMAGVVFQFFPFSCKLQLFEVTTATTYHD